MLASVIINTHNGEKFISEAITSAITQTYRNIEIIVFDNASTDKTVSIARQFNDERIKIITISSKVSLAKARNLAVKEAKGDWINFLDDDDIFLPSKIEESFYALKMSSKNDIGIIYCGTEIISDQSIKYISSWNNDIKKFNKKFSANKLKSGDIYVNMLFSNKIPLVSALILRRAYIESDGIFEDFNQVEDYDLFLKITKKFEVKAVKKILCKYRIHDSNLSHKQYLSNFSETSILLKNQELPIGLKIVVFAYHLTKSLVASIRSQKINIFLIATRYLFFRQ